MLERLYSTATQPVLAPSLSRFSPCHARQAASDLQATGLTFEKHSLNLG